MPGPSWLGQLRPARPGLKGDYGEGVTHMEKGSRNGQLIDITGVAERLGVTTRHVRRLVAERRIPFLKWGHLIRFDPREVESWLEEARVPAGRPGRPA